VPYRVDGRTNPILERRQHTEALFALSWSGRVPWK
jgi:hypothetical protein